MKKNLISSLQALLSVAAIVPLFVPISSHAGLVAHYTFDNADIVGTKAQDDKVGSNNTSEPASAVTTGATGKILQAYSFGGGSNNLMNVPAGVVPSGAAARTISIWFNQTSDNTSREDKFFGYGAATSGNAFDLSLEDGGIRLRYNNGSITFGSGFDFDGINAGWHHLVVRVNASASTFANVDAFLNGTQLAVTGTTVGGTTTTINTTSSAFGIGTSSISNTAAQGFTGRLDELRIYNHALTLQEIADLGLLDVTPPTLASSSIIDDQAGGPVETGDHVNYTVTFSEDIEASSVSSADFSNAGTSAIEFGTIAETSAGVFVVEIIPTTAGSLRLSVPTTANIRDLAGNVIDSDPAIIDNTTLTVAADTTPPTLAGTDIVDNRNGLPLPLNSPVTYTVSFNEDINAASVSAADFGNSGTATLTFGTITETTPGVFAVQVTATTLGTLRLRIAANASITNISGIVLATSPAIIDNTTITVRERRPNIVFFLVDDMGVHDTSVPFLLNSSGQPVSYNFNYFYKTPNMQTLASTGMRFTTAYAQSVCSPTRAGLLTGQTSARHGITDWVGANDTGSPVNWRINGNTATDLTLPKIFQAGGYRTIHIGKAHYSAASSNVSVESLGFDVNVGGNHLGQPTRFIGSGGYGVPGLDAYSSSSTFLTKALTLEANTAIQNAVNAGKPFFLNMFFYAVHTPLATNPDATGNYSGAVNSDHTRFATMIEGMDIAVGQIRQKLIDLGVAEDTLILFLGDNGSDSPATTQDNLPTAPFSDWPMRGKKGSKWEGGVRVPFIATWALPNASNPLQQALPISANSIETDIVTTWDIPATLLDFVGMPVPAGFGEDSHSLLPYLKGTPGTHRPQEIAIHYPHEHRSDFFSWIRQGNMKLIYNFQNNTHQLYNLATDPTETTNLAASQPAIVTALTRRLAEMLDDQWGSAGSMRPTITSTAPAGNIVSIPNVAAIDLDGDGIEDRNEDRNFNGLVDTGETDPDNNNSDNDNATDGQEAKLGTNPLNPGSFFYLNGNRQPNGSILLTWPSKAGVSFEIRGSTDLNDWSSVVVANVPAAFGSTTSYLVPASTAPRGFYRIGLK